MSPTFAKIYSAIRDCHSYGLKYKHAENYTKLYAEIEFAHQLITLARKHLAEKEKAFPEINKQLNLLERRIDELKTTQNE